MASIRITPWIAIDEDALEERFVRASGPGGQNVNKVATAVELRFDVAHSTLPPDVKARLATVAGHRMTEGGMLCIDSREHRTQAQNRAAARERLVALIARAATPRRARRKTRPSRAAKAQRITEKKQHGATKAARRQRGDDD